MALRLLDNQTFDTLHRFQLSQHEMVCSLMSCAFAEDPVEYFVVGTAYAIPEESEPNRGRILVLAVEEGSKLTLVAEKEVKGAVYNLNAFNGKLLAGVNAKMILFKWGVHADGQRELQQECTHSGSILALQAVTRGDFIVVGDLMKSISLLIYKPEEGTIEERARDYNGAWISAVEVLDDDTYIGAENSFNLYTLRKNSDAQSEEERNKLETVGEYHLGEFVNRFRHGSLVMCPPDSEAAQIPTLIFGTVNGVIGVLARLPHAQFTMLNSLQKSLNKVVKGTGGFLHEEWRSFSNERRTVESSNFIDGDLIEHFLDLKPESQDEVARLMEMSVEEILKRVEELARLH